MKRRILYFILVLFLCFTVSGCGGSFFEEDVLEIESITSRVEADGTTILKITYTDSTRKPDEFKIPKGASGVGIKELTADKDEFGKTTINISFTDETMEDVTFDVKDGVSIKGVEPVVDMETGDVFLKVLYSDGTESPAYPLPKGEKGDPGNGILGYTKEDTEDGGYKFIFHFTESEDVEVLIPGPQKGEDGRGIEQVMSYEEGEFYYLVLKYTDGTFSDPIDFQKPAKPNTWITGTQNPNIPTEDEKVLKAKIGDYLFDTAHQVIYVKTDYGWDKVVSFAQSSEPFTITFNLNDKIDGGPEAAMPNDKDGETKFKYTVIQNTYFPDNGNPIPQPTRTGYIFKGWYTEAIPSVTSGAFTDLTPILSDLTLYAQWEKIVE